MLRVGEWNNIKVKVVTYGCARLFSAVTFCVECTVFMEDLVFKRVYTYLDRLWDAATNNQLTPRYRAGDAVQIHTSVSFGCGVGLIRT